MGVCLLIGIEKTDRLTDSVVAQGDSAAGVPAVSEKEDGGSGSEVWLRVCSFVDVSASGGGLIGKESRSLGCV